MHKTKPLLCLWVVLLCYNEAVTANDTDGNHDNDNNATCSHHLLLGSMFGSMEPEDATEPDGNAGDLLDHIWETDNVKPPWWGTEDRQPMASVVSQLHTLIEQEIEAAPHLITDGSLETGTVLTRHIRSANANNQVISVPSVSSRTVLGNCKKKKSKTGTNTLRVCGECSATTTISGGWKPASFNELLCKDEACMSGEGVCRQMSLSIVLRKRMPNGMFMERNHPLRYGCVPHIMKGSVLASLL